MLVINLLMKVSPRAGDGHSVLVIGLVRCVQRHLIIICTVDYEIHKCIRSRVELSGTTLPTFQVGKENKIITS